MTNEEMQHIIEFMIQRQEIFSANLERLEANQVQLQTEVRGLAAIVGQIGEAQLRTEEAVQQTQSDLSHLSKIVTALLERNGGSNTQI